MTTPASKTAKILLEAARIIETNGHAKGTYFRAKNGKDLFDVEGNYVDPFTRAMQLVETDEGPRCCVMGAIYMATVALPGHYDSVDATDTFGRLADSLAERLAGRSHPNTAWDLPDWNDKPSRRKQEVVAALRMAVGPEWRRYV